MNSHPINQHYVPRLLLKNFSSKQSHIWVFDKLNKAKDWNFIKERPISKVASEQYFYDINPSFEEGSYEYELSKIEREIEPIITKIIQSKDLSSITAVEKKRFSVFIALQQLRTKSSLNYFKELSEDLDEKLSPFLITGNNFDHKRLWFDMLDSATEFSDYIFNKTWFLGESNKSFYTSDHPVVLQNTTVNDSLRGTLGIDSYGIEIYLPLTHSLILCMFCEKLLPYEGKTPLIDYTIKEHILNVNWLQFEQSERFIFSSNKDFQMIEENM